MGATTSTTECDAYDVGGADSAGADECASSCSDNMIAVYTSDYDAAEAYSLRVAGTECALVCCYSSTCS